MHFSLERVHMLLRMKDKLVRFGVAMEQSLLSELDELVTARDSTRSEALRDLVRGELSRSRAQAHVPAVGTLTLVYDHHVRDLTDHLTQLQHAMGEKVRSSMHVHLSHDLCLEVIVMNAYADELQAAAERILSVRGVTHGGIEIVPLALAAGGPAAKKRTPPAKHTRSHSHGPHAHSHAHPPPRGRTKP